jgi:hypothetical protein
MVGHFTTGPRASARHCPVGDGFLPPPGQDTHPSGGAGSFLPRGARQAFARGLGRRPGRRSTPGSLPAGESRAISIAIFAPRAADPDETRRLCPSRGSAQRNRPRHRIIVRGGARLPRRQHPGLGLLPQGELRIRCPVSENRGREGRHVVAATPSRQGLSENRQPGTRPAHAEGGVGHAPHAGELLRAGDCSGSHQHVVSSP